MSKKKCCKKDKPCKDCPKLRKGRKLVPSSPAALRFFVRGD